MQNEVGYNVILQQLLQRLLAKWREQVRLQLLRKTLECVGRWSKRSSCCCPQETDFLPTVPMMFPAVDSIRETDALDGSRLQKREQLKPRYADRQDPHEERENLRHKEILLEYRRRG